MKHLIAIFVLLTFAQTTHAGWFAGDLYVYDATQPRDHIGNGFKDALENNLDWRLFYNTPNTGAFPGLPAFLTEDKYNDQRQFVPLLGTQWQQGRTLIGIDARSPMPDKTLQTTSAYLAAHNGLMIFTDPTQPDFLASPSHAIAFQGLNSQGWHPYTTLGAQWDSLLTQGHKITLLGGLSTDAPTRPVGRTYVYANQRTPQDLIQNLQKGAAYVAESDGILVDFWVDDQIPGSTITTASDYIVRIRATSKHPISTVQLIANGQLIYEAQPFETRWQTRLRIDHKNYQYMRLLLESESGGYKTLTNPVYIFEDSTLPLTPTSDLAPAQNIHLSIDSALESMVQLSESAQSHILAEYLRSTQTRYPAVTVLEHRQDLVGDYILVDLLKHPDPKVRLGALFALVVRNPPELIDYLLAGLADPHVSIQEYAARMIYHLQAIDDNASLHSAITKASPSVQNYLIRSLNPSTYEADLVQYLIHLSGKNIQPAANAAIASLTQFGNRSFRVINTLLDSARNGHVQSVDIIGVIADPRLSEDLHDLYLNAPAGPLRKASFLALQNLNAPYPNRPEIQCPDLTSTPMIDGHISPIEWAHASQINRLVSDDDAQDVFDAFTLWIGRTKTHLLIAVACTLEDSLKSQAQIDLSISPSPQLEIPFQFSITHPQSPATAPLDPLLDLAQISRDQTWHLEGAVLLSDLGVDPETAIPYLRFNVALKSKQHHWAWTPTFGQPDLPVRFGNLYINPVANHKPLNQP